MGHDILGWQPAWLYPKVRRQCLACRNTQKIIQQAHYSASMRNVIFTCLKNAGRRWIASRFLRFCVGLSFVVSSINFSLNLKLWYLWRGRDFETMDSCDCASSRTHHELVSRDKIRPHRTDCSMEMTRACIQEHPHTSGWPQWLAVFHTDKTLQAQVYNSDGEDASS